MKKIIKKEHGRHQKSKKNILQKIHREITNDVTYDNSVIKYNTPTIIYYNNKEFKINTRKYYEQYEATWKCSNLRRSFRKLLIKINLDWRNLLSLSKQNRRYNHCEYKS